MTTTNSLTIYCDGGARGNPGPAACAFVVFDHAENLQYKCGKYLGIGTNNEAEYYAVIKALDWLSVQVLLGKPSLRFFLDSLLVVNQISGVFKVKEPRLRELVRQVQARLESLVVSGSVSSYSFSHVLRGKNQRADLLVNETLDSYQ